MAQPQIPPHYQLLLAGFDFDGLALDLYGDAEGEVLAVSQAGHKVDLHAVIRDSVFDAAQAAVDTAVRNRRQHDHDQIEFDRELAKLFRRAA